MEGLRTMFNVPSRNPLYDCMISATEIRQSIKKLGDGKKQTIAYEIKPDLQSEVTYTAIDLTKIGVDDLCTFAIHINGRDDDPIIWFKTAAGEEDALTEVGLVAAADYYLDEIKCPIQEEQSGEVFRKNIIITREDSSREIVFTYENGKILSDSLEREGDNVKINRSMKNFYKKIRKDPATIFFCIHK